LPFIPAKSIPVRDGRFILLWPLTLQMDSPPETPDEIGNFVKRTAKRLRDKHDRAADKSRLWAPVDDPIHHILPGAAPTRGLPLNTETASIDWANEIYAESIYFHDFVQSFLFQRAKTGVGCPPLYLFRRTDVRGAEVEWGGKLRRLDVERTNLYLFRTGAAILVCELRIARRDGDAPWTLADAQDFHDYFRRAYAPFFLSDHVEAEGGKKAVRQPGLLVVDKVSWLDGEGRPLAFDKSKTQFAIADAMEDVDRLLADRHGRRHPPIFGHWRALLDDALPLAGYASGHGAVWRHVVDERMPTIAAISVTADGEPDAMYRRIRPGDFMRLCFADYSGNADYSYDSDFLKNFDEDYAYDRFRSMGTRYLISGYAFVAIGAGDDFDKLVMTHVRRHYFQMMLLANLEMASLLGVSGRITEAMAAQERLPDPLRFERAMAAIQEEFLQFVHRFRFTGVSNQVQARELFGLLRRQLGLDPLFTDVQTEVNNAASFLRSRAQERATEAQTQLNMLAGFGVVMAAALSLLGSGFLMDKLAPSIMNAPIEKLELSQRLVAAAWVSGWCFGLGGLLLLLLRFSPRWERGRRFATPQALLGSFLIAAGAILFAGHYWLR
jgi:hypothetical protein